MSGGTIDGGLSFADADALDAEFAFDTETLELGTSEDVEAGGGFEPYVELASPELGTLTAWEGNERQDLMLLDEVYGDEAVIAFDEDTAFEFDLDPEFDEARFGDFDLPWSSGGSTELAFPDEPGELLIAADTDALSESGGLELQDDALANGTIGGDVTETVSGETSPEPQLLDGSAAWTPDGFDIDAFSFDDGESGFRAYLHNTTRLRTEEANAEPSGGEPFDEPDESITGRPLTAAEADYTRSLYPDIDVSRIRIVEGYDENMHTRDAVAYLPEGGDVTTIYMSSRVSSDDYLRESSDSGKSETFNHEIYHAAQYQGVVAGIEDFTGRDLWEPDTEYNTWYTDAIVHPSIGREETTAEESAVIIESALRSKETGEDVNDLLRDQGLTVWGEVDTGYLIETFTDGGSVPPWVHEEEG